MGRMIATVASYRAAARLGLTMTEAAGQLGVSVAAVSLAAKRHNIRFTQHRAHEGYVPKPKDAAASSPATSRGGEGEHSRAVLAAAPESESPAVLAEPSGGHHQIGEPAAASPSYDLTPVREAMAAVAKQVIGRTLLPKLINPPEDPVSPFTRRALSLHHKTGCTIEEARHIAALALDRRNAPELASANARQGNTRFPNKVPFRLSAPSLLEAAPSRDRRVRLHAHNMEHETCTGPLPRGSETAP